MSFAKQLLLADVAYSAWANQCLLEGCSAFTGEELARPSYLGHQSRTPVSHTSILATLRHFYDGERVWLPCLRDTPDGGAYLLPQDPAPALSLDALKQNWPKLWDGYRHWLQDQSESSLEVELIVQLPGSQPRLPRWKVLRHVLDHSQFHRGQVVAMIRALGLSAGDQSDGLPVGGRVTHPTTPRQSSTSRRWPLVWLPGLGPGLTGQRPVATRAAKQTVWGPTPSIQIRFFQYPGLRLV